MLYTKTVIKKQEAKRLLSNLGIKTPLSKSAFAPFAKNKKTIHKLKKTGHAKSFNIAKNPKYDEYQRKLASMVYKFFDKKYSGSGVKSMPQNQQLVEELHKPIIRKFKKRKVYAPFKDHTCGANLADMQSISKFNEGFRTLL